MISSAALGFLFLIGALASILTLSAGSTSFWQAWVYLGVFAGCTILITAYLVRNDRELLASRVKVGPAAETRPSQKVIQSFASIFFIGVFVVGGLDRRLGWSVVAPFLSAAADIMAALGFLVVFLAFRENSYSRATVEVSDAQKVISTGPYGVVRHPMYAGASILILFTPPALGSWVAMPCAIALVVIIALRLREEERFLTAHLPGYAEYCGKVRFRLMPSVW
jgi:protein-S-isoprenylcysteine O-methyltransferase Ste14